MATATASNLDILKSAIAEPSLTVIKTETPEPVKRGRGRPRKTAPNVPNATTVKAGVVSTETLTVDGFTFTWADGSVGAETLRAMVARDTKNPWFGIVEWVSVQGVGFLTVTRAADSKAKAPTSSIQSAITRGVTLANKYRVRGETVPANIRNFAKMVVEGNAQVKGEWRIIRLP